MRCLAACCILVLAACQTVPAPEPEPAPSPSAPEIADLPDYKPETAAACNAVPMRVSLSASGELTVNGEETDVEGMKISARRKNEACLNAPAMVFFNAPANAPAATREATLNALAEVITNIGVIETNN